MSADSPSKPLPSEVEEMLDRLEAELHRRYYECNDAFATPSSILLAVLNALAEARRG